MLTKILNVFKREYQTLNRIEISGDNLIQNYKYLAKINKKVKIAPVIKSNAYGHGLEEIAKILDPLGAPFFCVDSLYEAYELLKAKIKTPILIVGYTDPKNFKVKKLPFSYAVFDLETAGILNNFQPGCKVHIFVDTGMNREGVQIEDLPDFLKAIKQFNNLTIDGLMSHLASSDNHKDPLNKIQIKNFEKALQICKKNRIHPKWIHMSNSDGLLNRIPTSDVGIQNMARVGLALYGISAMSLRGAQATKQSIKEIATRTSFARNDGVGLKPVLTLKTKIIQIKSLKKGDRVGYGGTFITKSPMVLGVLPIGYYDGVDRRLSNRGWVIIDDIPCPIIGRVSMNIATIDLSKVPHPYLGQEVIIFSNKPHDPNSIENAAKLCQTIPYDLLVKLAQPIRRVIV